MEEEEWYFGNIDRKLAESKCHASGDYLVRYSEKQGGRFVLTCNFNSQGKHFVIQKIIDVSGALRVLCTCCMQECASSMFRVKVV